MRPQSRLDLETFTIKQLELIRELLPIRATAHPPKPPSLIFKLIGKRYGEIGTEPNKNDK